MQDLVKRHFSGFEMQNETVLPENCKIGSELLSFTLVQSHSLKLAEFWSDILHFRLNMVGTFQNLKGSL